MMTLAPQHVTLSLFPLSLVALLLMESFFAYTTTVLLQAKFHLSLFHSLRRCVTISLDVSITFSRLLFVVRRFGGGTPPPCGNKRAAAVGVGNANEHAECIATSVASRGFRASRASFYGARARSIFK